MHKPWPTKFAEMMCKAKTSGTRMAKKMHAVKSEDINSLAAGLRYIRTSILV